MGESIERIRNLSFFELIVAIEGRLRMEFDYYRRNPNKVDMNWGICISR